MKLLMVRRRTRLRSIGKLQNLVFDATFFLLRVNNIGMVLWQILGRSYLVDWNLVVDDLGPRLYRFFTMRYHDHSAADLVQEVLSRLYSKVSEGKFDPELGNLRSFAFGIAVNVQRESMRERVKWNYEELDSDHGAQSEQDLDGSEVRRISLRKAIEKLSTKEQQVLQLLLDRDLKLDEIGELLDIPLNTVKSHVSRAKQKLRKILSDQEVPS